MHQKTDRLRSQELTQIQRHGNENYETKPGTEEGDEVDDGNDDIQEGGNYLK